ncbi:hypothetical protein C8Q76DRAFT_607790 [Earliella scabrosa]|nr:hypothetical protein C8Q76DRAFT_607790 [Earliella scabrosa]
MGQRHQAFLIARVRPIQGPPSYRCVGAFHHQWCQDKAPLRATRRFIRLLQRSENAAVVRGELRALDGKYEARPGRLPSVPCPFTLSLLGMAWTTCMDERYYSGVTFKQSILDANMGCWDGHNDDGISVIDVTDVEWPAYCFSVRNAAAPLSAYDYLSCYFRLDAPPLKNPSHIFRG